MRRAPTGGVAQDARSGGAALGFAAGPARAPVRGGTGPQVLIGGDAVLHFGHGATATLLGVLAARVAAHLGDCVENA